MAKVGRPTNAERAARALRLAQEAEASAPPPVEIEALEPETSEQQAPQPTGRAPEPRNEPRRLAMEEIIERHNRTSGIKDEPSAPEKPAETETPPAEVEAGTDKVGAPAPVSEKPPSTQVEPPKPELVRVKVDGQEFEVPKADVEAAGGITAYQKDKAAENRLKKANEDLAEVRRTKAEITQLVQLLQKQQKPDAPAAPVQSDDEFVQSRIQLINFGTPEEQALASRELREKLSPKIDQNSLVRQAIVTMRQEDAERQFATEFPDIVYNPLLLKLIIQMKNERLAQLKDVPDWSVFYRSIGNEVRGAVGRQSQPAQPSTASTTQPVDKEARKADIVNLPTAAARAALPKEEKPETREDVLNQMRKSRGQPTG